MTRALLAAVLAAATIAVYLPVRGHEFVQYDDPIYVVDNPNLRGGLSLASIWQAFAEPYETNWIPLTWISLQIDYDRYGLDPAGYLLTNVALHLASTLLLFAALVRMTGATWRPAFVAGVFALHPLHVESVAWVSERKDVLAGFFWMLTLWAYAGYARRPGGLRLAGVTLALVLGLLAKSVLVTLPFVLLLLDDWPLGRLRDAASGRLDPARVRRAVLEKLPLFAAAAAASAVTFAVQRELGAMDHGDALPLSVRLPNALLSYGHYLRDSVWPSGLAVFYPHPQDATPRAAAAAVGLGLAAITAAVLRGARRAPWAPVGWLWFLGTLVPMIGLVQVGMQARADRYMYLPLVGLAILVAWGAGALAQSPARRRAVAAAGLAALVALTVTARAQVHHWRDTASLYAHAVAVTQDNFLAHQGLVAMCLAEGDLDAAEEHAREAVRLKPRWPGAHLGLGDVYAARGELEEAIRAYDRALRLGPRIARGHTLLAAALLRAGRHSEAIGRARYAVKLAHGDQRADAHAVLGAALVAEGRLEEGAAAYAEALAIRPDFLEAHANRGFALLRLERLPEAEQELTAAHALAPDSVEVLLGLADVARLSGREGEAAARYREVLRLDPEAVAAANNLAWLLTTGAAGRDPDEAVALAQRAARLTGESDATVLDTLASAYAAAGRYPEAAGAATRAAALAEAAGDAEHAATLRRQAARYEAGGG